MNGNDSFEVIIIKRIFIQDSPTVQDYCYQRGPV